MPHSDAKLRANAIATCLPANSQELAPRRPPGLYEGKAKEVEQMTIDALAEGRAVQEVLNEGLIAGMSVAGRISNTTFSMYLRFSSPPAP